MRESIGCLLYAPQQGDQTHNLTGNQICDHLVCEMEFQPTEPHRQGLILFNSFFKDFIYLFLEGGKGR